MSVTVIVGERNIRVAQFLARYHALRLECNGFKRKGRSVTRICREEYGLTGRTKVQVMVQMDEIKKELDRYMRMGVEQ